jgi:RNA polymerase sigma-70 factor (ECF subfamily)
LEHERSDRIQAALRRLPDTYRLVLVLRYWHDMSYDEIAQVTGLTESALKTRLHRARHMLAEALGPEEQQLWEAETATS